MLLRVEPSVEELTKEDYEKRMGIKPEGPKSPKAKDVRKPVGQDPKEEAKAQVPVSSGEGRAKEDNHGTRKDLIEILKGKGFKAGDLNKKRRGELIEML